MKGLVARHLDESGISYSAQSEITAFLDALSSGYAHAVRDRAEWAVQRLNRLSDSQVRELFEESIGDENRVRRRRGTGGRSMNDDLGFFFIESLTLKGPAKADAQLTFADGLNVVSGASDTGKSYALSCIDFAFGASSAPSPIPEAAGDYALFWR